MLALQCVETVVVCGPSKSSSFKCRVYLLLEVVEASPVEGEGLVCPSTSVGVLPFSEGAVVLEFSGTVTEGGFSEAKTAEPPDAEM
jgi:hypothetical protein